MTVPAQAAPPTPSYVVEPVTGLGEVTAGDDLAALLLAHTTLTDGDIVIVTSKVVSKAEGRVVDGDRAAALAAETDRVVARRGATAIVRTHHGLVMAAAGIDASNTAPGTVVLLPRDPDASARSLRARVQELAGVTVGVVVSDTSGRAWRTGQTDIAVGAAGVPGLVDHAGRVDPYGNPLVVTAPAVADELAGAGDLVKGKVSMAPVAVVRGLDHLVLPRGDDGPGAASLVRPEASDLFGLGAREAVHQAALASARPDAGDRRGFGAPVTAEELLDALEPVLHPGGRATVAAPGEVAVGLPADARGAGAAEARATMVAHAHGWVPVPSDDGLVARFRPGLP